MRWTALRVIVAGVVTMSAAGLAGAQQAQLQPLPRAQAVVLQDAQAHAFARQRGWPIETRDASGKPLYLRAVRNGFPLYDTTFNVNSADTMSLDELWPGGGTGLSLTGSGIVVGLWDGGLARTTHDEFGARVFIGESGGITDHATHVCGTIAAAGVVAAAKGMAYAANVKTFVWDDDQTEMAAEANGTLRLSNHSYGQRRGWNFDGGWAWWGDVNVSTTEDYLFGFYDELAQQWDQIAVDHPRYLMVKAAGNDRNDSGPSAGNNFWIRNADGDWIVANTPHPPADGPYDCLPQRSNCKNLLVVGAVADIVGGYTSPGDVAAAPFSSYGPTDDGRIKPDLVANGIDLYSTSGTGDSSYKFDSGTSMAAPSVTGAAALLLRHWRNDPYYSSDPLSSTMKAIMIHSADEAGSAEGPDYAFGWGLINAQGAAELITLDQTSDITIIEDTLSDGETFILPIVPTGGDVKVTVVWTDPAGTVPPTQVDPPDAILVNDLDVRLVRDGVGGTTYIPWRLNPANVTAAATRGDNFRDNVEVILAHSPSLSRHEIRVTHKGSLSGGSQRFSLVVTGAIKGAERLYVDHTATGSETGHSWDDAFTTLDDALARASIFPSDVFDVWVARGTYTPTGFVPARTDTFDLPPNVRLYGGFIGSETALSLRNVKANPTELSGDLSGNDIPLTLSTGRTDNAYHVLTSDGNTADTLLDGFTIRGGHADGASTNGYGGGLFIPSGALTVRNCTFIDNEGLRGGGMYTQNASTSIRTCMFTRNEAQTGAGIRLSSGSTAIIYDSVFLDNVGTSNGGAVYCTGSTNDFFNCRFLGNTSPYGGAVYEISNANVDYMNCVFTGNHATTRGGAIRNNGAVASMFHSTFAGNTCQGLGGGVHSLNGTIGGICCIFWNNTDSSGSLSDAQMTIDGSGYLFGNCTVQGGFSGLSMSSADPLFVNADGWDDVYGTLDDNVRPNHGSPVIDAGIPVGVADAPDADDDSNTTESFMYDLAGASRSAGAHPDHGAYEYSTSNPPVIFVRSDQNGLRDGLSWLLAYQLLETAVNRAGTVSTPVEIWVKQGTYIPSHRSNGAVARSETFDIPSGTTIVGGFAGSESTSNAIDPAAHPVILSGDLNENGATSDNAFHVVRTDGAEGATVFGVTIRDGNANGLSDDRYGGGIYSIDSDLTVYDSIIENNHASLYGGGVYARAARVTLISSIFKDNDAGSLAGAAYLLQTDALFDRVDFLSNTATAAAGAVRVNSSLATLLDARFLGNTAGTYGGAIAAHSSAATSIMNSLIAGNEATSYAGAIQASGSTALSLLNTTVAHNHAGGTVGGVSLASSVSGQVVNSILARNSTDSTSGTENAQMVTNGAALVVDYSLVEGWSGTLAGVGSFAGTPAFADAAGPDTAYGTPDDDYRPGPGSDAIDAGDSTAVPAWLTTDLAGAARVMDAVNYADTGLPDASGDVVDAGAYEAATAMAPPPAGCAGDIDGDGDTDVFDFAIFAPNFTRTDLTPFTSGDLDGDGDCDVFDFAILAPDFMCTTH